MAQSTFIYFIYTSYLLDSYLIPTSSILLFHVVLISFIRRLSVIIRYTLEEIRSPATVSSRFKPVDHAQIDQSFQSHRYDGRPHLLPFAYGRVPGAPDTSP